MFCAHCYNNGKSTTGLHSSECQLMDFILNPNVTSSMRMAVRTFNAAVDIFDGSIDDLERFIKENSESKTVYDFEGPLNKKEKFLAVNSLISDDKTKVSEEFFEQLVLLSPKLNENPSQRQFIKNFLMKQTKIATLNYHEIYNWPLKKGGLQDGETNVTGNSLAYKRGVISSGNGSFPFSSLLNHSCCPNVSRVFIDATTILVVTKPVDKGEQLFDNYGYSYTNVPKDYRQMELQKQYKFKCKCHACEKDWPLMPLLKILDKACFNKAKQISRELNLGGFNQRKAIDKFKVICDILEKGRKNYPSLELCSLEQSFSAFLEMISKPAIEFS